MTKKWQITITEKDNDIKFGFEHEDFSPTEMLGLLELLRDVIICRMKCEQRSETKETTKGE